MEQEREVNPVRPPETPPMVTWEFLLKCVGKGVEAAFRHAMERSLSPERLAELHAAEEERDELRRRLDIILLAGRGLPRQSGRYLWVKVREQTLQGNRAAGKIIFPALDEKPEMLRKHGFRKMFYLEEG